MMKKICAVALSVILVCMICFPMSVTAASNKYDISELGLQVTIPGGYAVITEDTPASDPIFTVLGRTKAEVLEGLKADNVYLDAIADSLDEEIVVTMAQNIIDNFCLI